MLSTTSSSSNSGTRPEVRTRPAEERDVPRLMQVINLAYRGSDPTAPPEEQERIRAAAVARAWTTEAHLVAGLRTTPDELRGLAASDPALRAFYVAEVKVEEEEEQKASSDAQKNNEDGQWLVVGCVVVEKCDDGGHLGMFAVDPARQSLGIGRVLLSKGEEHVWDKFGADLPVVLYVVSVRPELLAYYERRGYVDTKQTEPFPASIYTPLVPEGLNFRILKKHRPALN